MARRNAQDLYNAASIIWDQIRDPNMEPEPTPKSTQPHIIIRRGSGQETRITPSTSRAKAALIAFQVRAGD